MSKKTIFVTGASGFIGDALCKRLVSEGRDYNVIALVRTEEQARAVEAWGGRPVIADFANIERARAQLCSAHWVFHIGGDATFGNSADYQASNIAPTAEILSILQNSRVLERFVFFSSIGAVDRQRTDSCAQPLRPTDACYPCSEYGKSKLEGERLVRESGLPYTIIRPTWVYGPGMRANSHIATLIGFTLDKRAISKIHFPGRVSVVYIDDLTRSLAELVAQGKGLKEVYFVDDGNPQPIGRIFDLCRGLLGVACSIQIPSLARSIMRRFSRFLPFSVWCLVSDVLVSETKIFADLGIAPEVSFEEGIRRTAAYIQERRSGVVMVTGAASGIGLEYAKALSAEGKRLLLVDRDPAIAAVAGELAQIACTADLSSYVGVSQISELLSTQKIFVEGLINCAGLGWKGDFACQSQDSLEKVLYVNSIAPMQLARLVLPEMLKRRHGFILNIASSIATVPLPGMLSYAASKAAMLSFGKSLWGEVSGTGVRVLTVLPSGTKTRFQSSSGVKVLHDGRGLLDPRYVAVKSLELLRGSNRPIARIGLSGAALSFLGSCLPPRFEILYWKLMMRTAR